MLKQIIAYGILIFTANLNQAYASSADVKLHPTPAEIGANFAELDTVLTNLNEPLFKLSANADTMAVTLGMQARLVQVRDLVRQWKVIIDASRGAEIPSASDLFTIYTEVLNIEESSASTLQTNKLNDRSSVELITAATAVTRAQTKLLPLIETLQYAVADRIESEEARCAKNLRNFGRK